MLRLPPFASTEKTRGHSIQEVHEARGLQKSIIVRFRSRRMSVHHHFGIRALGEIRGKTGALRYTLRAASCDGIVNQFHLTLHLLYRLAGGALGILELALA